MDSKGSKYTTEQLKAIRHTEGPIMIIAGAGTGKTTVITQRIKNLIENKKAKNSQILSITFSQKAALEMEARLNDTLPLGETVEVHTFHALCDEILRSHGMHIGLPQNFDLLTKEESFSLLKSNLWESPLDYFRPLGNPDKFISELINHIDRLKDENISPQEYSAWSQSINTPSEESRLDQKHYLELSQFYSYFQKIKLTNKMMDFSDLIYYSVHLFSQRPNILNTYQNKWKYILVDEYQDTNYIQSQLVYQLSSKHKNICVVGDDDQAIYKWRGASTTNLVDFSNVFPESEKIILTQNFRSKQKILDHAYSLIQYNNPNRLESILKIDKKLKSQTTSDDCVVECHKFLYSYQEAEFIKDKIIEITSSKNKVPLSEIAILIRANSHANHLSIALEQSGIPYRIMGPSGLYAKPEIRELITYLKTIGDIHNDANLIQAMSSRWFNIEKSDLSDLISQSRKEKTPLLVSLENSQNQNIANALGLIKKHQVDSLSLPAISIVYDLLDKTGWLSKISTPQTLEDDEVSRNIVLALNKITQFSENSKSLPTSQSFLSHVQALEEVGESPQSAELDWKKEDSIKIITIHSAKGLEFETVFLPSLTSQRFPSTSRSDPLPLPLDLVKDKDASDAHLQEERRLFYVGMTRAKSQLFLTYSDLYGNNKRQSKPSQFISESKVVVNNAPSSNQLSFTKFPNIKANHSPSTPHLVEYLDASRIETFKDCPLHYYCKYVLGLKTPPSASSSFGNTIHKVLKDYISNSNQDIEKLLESNWTSKGYEDKRKEDLFKKRAKQILLNFSNINTENNSIHLEYSFKFNLNSGLTIGGKIDRIDLKKDGSIEIIDYKTSDPKNQLSIKDAQKDIQLSVYALAAFSDSIPNISGQNPITLTLYYLQSQEKISITKSPSEADSIKDEIIDIQQQIQKSEFRCSNNIICQKGKCDYSNICQNTQGIIHLE